MLTLEQVMSKSSKKLVGLHPVVSGYAVKLIEQSYAIGIMIVVTDGYRSIDEQNRLYAQGRTKPGDIVTNARGGTSYHNYGLAFDFALLMSDGHTVKWDTIGDYNKDQFADWMQVVDIGMGLGLKWGGNFIGIYDPPHFEYTFGLSIAQLKNGKRPPKMEEDAARKLIKICQALWGQSKTQEDKDEYHNLANALRVAIGEKAQ